MIIYTYSRPTRDVFAETSIIQCTASHPHTVQRIILVALWELVVSKEDGIVKAEIMKTINLNI